MPLCEILVNEDTTMAEDDEIFDCKALKEPNVQDQILEEMPWYPYFFRGYSTLKHF